MSYREIEQRFTRTELASMAWRSRETAFKMTQDTKKKKSEDKRNGPMTTEEALKMFQEQGIEHKAR